MVVLVELLLMKGASIAATDKSLHRAARNGHTETVELLEKMLQFKL